MADDRAIKARWEALGGMDRATLRLAWAEAFGDAPPRFISMMFMRKALIWHRQCRTSGGLRPELKRALQSAAGGKTVRPQVPQIRAGTQIVRDWNGRRYQVDVTADGFRMNGETFRSLSAIARRITGTNWSGPRFFGLNGQTGPRK